MSDRGGWFLSTHLLAAILSLAAVRSASALQFTNVAGAAGINYAYNPVTIQESLNMSDQEYISGGAAAGDYDNDGWVDLYVTRYYAPDVLYRNVDDGNGNRIFMDVTATAFGALPTRKTNGAAWGDIDNDGDSDLYVASIDQSQHFLYINDGAGHFADEAVARGAAIGDSVRTTAGSSVSFGDYDNDGWLDAYVGEWRDQGTNSIPAQARLLRNLGASSPGNFEDVTDAAGVSMDIPLGSGHPWEGKTFSFTPRFVDFDRDGDQDIPVVSDYDTTRVFINNGDGTFDNVSADLGLDFGTTDMGFTVADYNGDGLLDWFNSDSYIQGDVLHDGNRLFMNDGNGGFIDATPPIPPGSQNTTIRNAGWGWGTDAFDYDNDGDLDIAVTNGFRGNTDRNRFFVNNYNNTGIGVFTERALSLGITEMLNNNFDDGNPNTPHIDLDNVDQGRGLLTFDYDKDGDLDFFIVNNHQAPLLYRNNGSTNKWLKIELEGTMSNRDGIGAFITVTPDLAQPNKTLVTEIDGSSNYLSQSEMTAHFGFGALVGTIDLIRIEWPASGIVQEFTDVAPNQLLQVVESNGDYNNDGIVDAADYTVWRNMEGTEGVDPGSSADGNGDGMIDEDDYMLWRQTYGRLVHLPLGGAGGGGLAGATIPEPAAGVLAGLAVLILGSRLNSRRKRRPRASAPVAP